MTLNGSLVLWGYASSKCYRRQADLRSISSPKMEKLNLRPGGKEKIFKVYGLCCLGVYYVHSLREGCDMCLIALSCVETDTRPPAGCDNWGRFIKHEWGSAPNNGGILPTDLFQVRRQRCFTVECFRPFSTTSSSQFHNHYMQKLEFHLYLYAINTPQNVTHYWDSHRCWSTFFLVYTSFGVLSQWCVNWGNARGIIWKEQNLASTKSLHRNPPRGLSLDSWMLVVSSDFKVFLHGFKAVCLFAPRSLG